MDLYTRNRWVMGETLDSLHDDTRVCVVHTEYPRLIATLISEYGQPKLDIHWSEIPISAHQQARVI